MSRAPGDEAAGRGEGRRGALVTGSTRGIGRAIALRLARDGYVVGLNFAHDERAAAAALEEIGRVAPGSLALRADITRAAECGRLVREFQARCGRLDVLVNNAGPWLARGVLETSDEDWRRMVDGNLGGAFWCARAALPAMRGRRAGAIVNIGALNAEVSAGMTYDAPAYFAAKSGLLHLTRTLAASEGPYGIRVNAVNPGFIETENYTRLAAAEKERWKSAIPLRRFGAPDEVAAAVSFLVSDQAAYVSGTIVHVHGGLWI